MSKQAVLALFSGAYSAFFLIVIMQMSVEDLRTWVIMIAMSLQYGIGLINGGSK